MAQLAKSGVPGNEPADSSEKCELRAEALAPPAPKRPVPASWQQPQIQSNSFQANKRTKFGGSSLVLFCFNFHTTYSQSSSPHLITSLF